MNDGFFHRLRLVVVNLTGVNWNTCTIAETAFLASSFIAIPEKVVWAVNLDAFGFSA
jgi:hypothetical protein